MVYDDDDGADVIDDLGAESNYFILCMRKLRFIKLK